MRELAERAIDLFLADLRAMKPRGSVSGWSMAVQMPVDDWTITAWALHGGAEIPQVTIDLQHVTDGADVRSNARVEVWCSRRPHRWLPWAQAVGTAAVMAEAQQVSVRSKIAKRSSARGKTFEREIAQDLRELLDTEEVKHEIATAGPRDRAKAMVKSVVRRGQQGRGAHEPDVITPMDWWIEAGSGKTIRGRDKLLQAVRDMRAPYRRPVSVTRRRGERRLTACLFLGDLIARVGVDAARSFAIEIDYADWIRVVKAEVGREVP